MGWLTNALAGLWGYVSAAVFAAALAVPATYWVTSRGYQVTIADLQRDQAKAQATNIQKSLDQLQGFIAQMHAAGVDYSANQAALFSKLDALKKEFHNVAKAKPLPADCRPDDVRVRNLSEAVDTANQAAAGAAGGYGETMRTTH